MGLKSLLVNLVKNLCKVQYKLCTFPTRSVSRCSHLHGFMVVRRKIIIIIIIIYR